MAAIMLNEANLPMIIQETENLTVEDVEALTRVFLNKNFVFIRNYFPPRGQSLPWTIVPYYIFLKTFDFDHEKIKTEWSQFVRP